MELRRGTIIFGKNRPRFFILLLTVMAAVLFLQDLRAQEEEDYKILREIILNEFRGHQPEQRGGKFPDVLARFPADGKKAVIALAACLDMGAEMDQPLFNQLIARKIPFSLFADQAWIEHNAAQLKSLFDSGLIQLENHGSFCRALSVDGQVSGNSPKTTGVEEVFEEVESNARAIERFSGRLPRFYRSGQGYYDDVALKIVNVLGYQAVEGDLKLKAKDVETDASLQLFLKNIKPGSIIFIPANRPGSSEKWADKFVGGLAKAGYSAVALDDVAGNEAEDV